MLPTSQLSQEQRVLLLQLLESRLAGFKQNSASHLQGLTQAERANLTLLQDADDASQRAGEHEVEGIVSDIDSAEFTAVRDALHRIHGATYGLCCDCQEAIPFERLRLEPQALRCTACQTLYERNLSL